MATVFRTFKSKRNPATGKRVPVLDAKGRPIPHERWRFEYTDYQGRRRTASGSASKAQTTALAARVQAREDEIRRGFRPAPKREDEHALRPIEKVIEEYLDYGAACGGLRGKPWGPVHLRRKAATLEWWVGKLNLKVLGDLNGNILARVEQILRDYHRKGRTGKTCRNQAEALRSFCRWCVKLSYLGQDPLQSLSQYDASPTTIRRAFTPEECERLLLAAPPDRRLIYAVALASGLRANEIRSLRVMDLDVVNKGLHLSENWTKNRRGGFQPLPLDLVDQLAQSARGKDVAAPLLFNASRRDFTRLMDDDLKAADIKKRGPGGVVCFHSLRHSFINILLEQGAGAKEVQDLARHQTLSMTMNHYAKSSMKRKRELAEKLGETINIPELPITGPERKVVGLETHDYHEGILAPRKQLSS